MADYYTLLTNAGLAYETACKANGLPIKLSHMSVGDGNGVVYNPDATATSLKREVWRGEINALLQDADNPTWLVAELSIPDDVGGWSVREAGIWTETGILYAVIKYPESYKPILATSGAGKEFYIRAIFQTSNASSVTLVIDENVVKATRAWVTDYVASELNKLDAKKSVRVVATAPITLSGAQQIDSIAVVAGDRVLATAQANGRENGIWIVANNGWVRALDADSSIEVTPGLFVNVEEGALYADSLWQLVTNGPIVLGATALAFEMLAGKTGIGAGTYRSLSVDKYGRVIGGSNPTTLSGYGITDAYSSNQADALFAKRALLADLPYRGMRHWGEPGVYTWVVPAGVAKGYALVKGGGGSGRNSQVFGPGGGGGGVAEGLVVLVPGATITITVGAGGLGVTYTVSGSPGLPGASSSFGDLMSATGGEGGGQSGGGGRSGVGTGGTLNYGLGDGQTGGRASPTVYGFSGGGGGAGGAGVTVDNNGVSQSSLRAGQAPGAGGGGRMDNGGYSGAGAAGSVTIWW